MIATCPSCSKPNRVPPSRLNGKAHCASCKSPLVPFKKPIPVEYSSEFDELIRESALPVLVDFWARWCGPCHTVAPELAKLADSRAGSLIVAKVDTDALPEVAGRFGIRSIPTMILFRNGAEAKRVSGAMGAEAIGAQFAI